MSKMFYTLEETKAALGKSEDQIKELARQGRLREFRDGQRLMFKADQVEALKAELAGSGGDEPLELSDADSDSMISLSDDSTSPAASGAGLALADTALGGTKAGSTAGTTAGTTAGGSTAPVEDTALASDLGLSGSISGLPSSGKTSSVGLSGSSQSSHSGIDVFQDDAEKIDPSAATSIAPGINPDQISIESVGSGSGLLDLTRESDDTSLGAELMDEIAPSASGARRSPSATESALSASALTGSSTGVGLSEPRGTAARAAPAMVEAPDPLAPAFGMAALGAACVLLVSAFALVSGVAGYHPDLLRKMGSSDAGGFSFLIVMGAAFILPVILFAVGFVMGRR